jgi:hypothetical protein
MRPRMSSRIPRLRAPQPQGASGLSPPEAIPFSPLTTSPSHSASCSWPATFATEPRSRNNRAGGTSTVYDGVLSAERRCGQPIFCQCLGNGRAGRICLDRCGRAAARAYSKYNHGRCATEASESRPTARLDRHLAYASRVAIRNPQPLDPASSRVRNCFAGECHQRRAHQRFPLLPRKNSCRNE